jgi:hypothetical protein
LITGVDTLAVALRAERTPTAFCVSNSFFERVREFPAKAGMSDDILASEARPRKARRRRGLRISRERRRGGGFLLNGVR